jgi:adenylosuccinate synthase
MGGIVLVGLQWGDEGKGKISAYLCRRAGLAVRFNGGANAGHTVTIGDRELRLHLLPAGVVSCKRAAIGPGVYVDLATLVEEIDSVQEVVGEFELIVSPRAHIVLSLHKELDGYLEEVRGGGRIGTTRRGIGPAAMYRYARMGLRIADIMEDGDIAEILKTLPKLFELKCRGMDLREEEAKLRSALGKIRRYVGSVSRAIKNELSRGGTVIFEGAQGTMLDLDHGTYPYVTSSTTLASAAAHGAGISLKEITSVVGVAKAYTTRVGEGPLPTEISGALADEVRTRGKEYGATTGRPRRIGWLDLFQLKYAAELNGVDGLIITRLDTISGLNTLKVCVGYEIDGVRIEEFPETVAKLVRVKPIYKELAGWRPLTREEIDRIVREGYDALPREAKSYVELIEETLDTPVKLISIGPRIEDVIEK